MLSIRMSKSFQKIEWLVVAALACLLVFLLVEKHGEAAEYAMPGEALTKYISSERQLPGQTPWPMSAQTNPRINPSVKPSTRACPPLSAEVYFKSAEALVSPVYADMLWEHARFLREHSGWVISIDGYADYTGGTHNNQRLSILRAQQVASILLEFGAPEPRIDISGHGEAMAGGPLGAAQEKYTGAAAVHENNATGSHSNELRRQRRVEIHYYPVQQSIAQACEAQMPVITHLQAQPLKAHQLKAL